MNTLRTRHATIPRVSSRPRSTSPSGLLGEVSMYNIKIYNYTNEFAAAATAFSIQKTRSVIHYYTRMQMTRTAHLLRRSPPEKPSLRGVDPSSSVVKTSTTTSYRPIATLRLKKYLHSLFIRDLCTRLTLPLLAPLKWHLRFENLHRHRFCSADETVKKEKNKRSFGSLWKS